MNREQLISMFSKLITWTRSDQRAPHKPLLVLLALGEWQRGRKSLLFADVVDPLTALLKDFGPPRKAHHPEYPFWRLQNDGVWEVGTDDKIEVGGDGAPTKGELIRTAARGQFLKSIQSCLAKSPEFVGPLAQSLLDAHFPKSLHQDILVAVGLDVSEKRAGGGGRDPNFRRVVLTAYNYRCAVCGLQILLSGSPVGLEAAHIRWHQAHGPSCVQNALSLCSLHHKVFDLGGITITPQLTVMVSDQVSGLSGFTEYFMTYHSRPISLPTHGADVPKREFIEWHHREVFRGSPRPV